MMRVSAAMPSEQKVVAELASPHRFMESTMDYHTQFSTIDSDDKSRDTDPLPPMSEGL
jgi:hypothetical protein